MGGKLWNLDLKVVGGWGIDILHDDILDLVVRDRIVKRVHGASATLDNINLHE
jgi:hypothetical protein